jgi:hypothetical protein
MKTPSELKFSLAGNANESCSALFCEVLPRSTKKIQLISLILRILTLKTRLRGKKVKFREKRRKVNFLI